MARKDKPHSAVAFGILGGVLGCIAAFVISIPLALRYEDQEWMTTEDAFEAAGNTMAPFALILIAGFAYLGVRWARKRNQARPPS